MYSKQFSSTLSPILYLCLLSLPLICDKGGIILNLVHMMKLLENALTLILSLLVHVSCYNTNCTQPVLHYQLLQCI